MTTYTMTNPNAAVGTVQASRSGSTYTVAAGGILTGVAASDLVDLERAGWCVSNMNPFSLPLLSARNSDGSVLAAAAAAGKFGAAITLGTSDNLISQVANGTATVSDVVLFDTVLPNDYPAGTNLTLDINANVVLTTGATLTTETLTAHAYAHPDQRASGGKAQTTDLIASGNAVTLTGTAADYTWTIAGANLLPGERLIISNTVSLVESAGTNANAIISYVGMHI